MSRIDAASCVPTAAVLSDSTGLVPAAFGDSDRLSVGTCVVAIGSPLVVDLTVTGAAVSRMRQSRGWYRFAARAPRNARALLDAGTSTVARAMGD